MKLPRAHARGIFSLRFVGSEIPPKRKLLRIHPRTCVRGFLRRGIKIKYQKWTVTVLMYILVFLPLGMTGIIGHPFNTILGIDKLIFGTIIGSLVFLFSVWLDKKVRKVRGHQFFNYQKIIFPLIGLALISLVLYLLIK